MGLFRRLAHFLQGENRTASAALERAKRRPPPVVLESSTKGMGERIRVLQDEQRNGVLPQWVPVGLDWRFENIEAAWQAAEIGNLTEIAKMIEAMRHIGVVAGLMSTRTSMVRLPLKFAGDPHLCGQLRGEPPQYDQRTGRRLTPGRRGVFRRMFRPGTLRQFLFTGILAGVAVGEFVDDPVTGIPVLHTRDLHRLRYDWGLRKWFYRGNNGEYAVNPGDGRWILWFPEDDHRPWRSGRWLPLSLAFVVALTSVYDRARYQARNADPLKWISVDDNVPPEEVDRLEDFVRHWWERAPGIVLRYGAKAGLEEMQGRGHEVFKDNMQWAEAQIKYTLSGNTVTADGRGGISDGGDLFRDIAESLIEDSAESLAECITEQGIAPWAWRFWGVSADEAPSFTWDIRSPQRRDAEAEAAKKLAEALEQLDKVYASRGRRVNADQWFDDHGLAIPTEPLVIETTGELVDDGAAPVLPSATTPLQLEAGGDVIDVEWSEEPAEVSSAGTVA